MSEPLEDRLDLFLAGEDEGRPMLEDGLSARALVGAPKPKTGSDKELRRVEESWNDLSLQEWAVIAAHGSDGDRMLEAIEPLCKLREREQKKPVKIFRVAANMDGRQAGDWKQSTFWPEGTPEEDVPLYTLLLGDLHQTSAELQHVLATNTLVGRIHFSTTDGEPDIDGYAAYADKVVRFAEEGTPEASPDFLFYTAPDGSAATVTGKARLVSPSVHTAKNRVAAGKLAAASVREVTAESVEELLGGACGPRPSVLLSVSHGLGPPRGGFRSDRTKWQRQGAMVIDHSEILDAERMRGQTFLPGGMWFYLACFGAGTPASSAYHAWLSQLSETGAYKGSLTAVLRALPADGDRPFIAALPQAALANPKGPLAVIGHLDLAWTYGFSGTKSLSESRKSRILTPLEKLVSGNRAGIALGKLMMEYAEANDELMREYQLDADAQSRNRPSSVDPTAQAHRWMLRNDLRGYILLGDPAARLPLQKYARRKAAIEGTETQKASSGSVPEVSTKTAPKSPKLAEQGTWKPALRDSERLSPEGAVLSMLAGDEAPRVIAARAGISLARLWQWTSEYLSAGRAQLPGDGASYGTDGARAERTELDSESSY